MTSRLTSDLSFADLASSIAGRVMTPADEDYDAMRQVFLGDVDRRPAAIARVANASDVARVIGFARETGVELAVRCGGHSNAGQGTSDGGLVLDVRDMTSVDIDAPARTVWADAGLSALELCAATDEHGLAVGFGDTGSVGISGITLGGGVGYMVRKHGLTIDSLLAAEIVTADGELRHVDADHEPDLYWAIRGGGGNFGVATRFQYQLQDVRQLTGGLLVLPATAETIEGFMSAADAPYAEIYPPEDPAYRPTPVQRTMFLDHIGQKEAKTILDYLEASDASLRAAQLRVLGGAMARVPVAATAFAHRASRILAVVVNFYNGTAEDRARRAVWADGFAAALHQGDDGAYVNFLADEGQARVRAAYPGATWDRLVAIKQRYDPANLFRLNQNIPPNAGAVVHRG